MWRCDNVGGLSEHVTCHMFWFLGRLLFIVSFFVVGIALLCHWLSREDSFCIYDRPVTGINGFCAYNVWIKCLLFQSSGFYNKEKLEPVLSV